MVNAIDNTMDVVIDPAGVVRFVFDDALAPLLEQGRATVKRASHVEPATDGQGACCGWSADLSPSGGPVLGPFPTRGQAVAAETEWIRERL